MSAALAYPVSTATPCHTKAATPRCQTVLLTGPVSSPSLRAAIDELAAGPGLRHVIWSPLQCDAAAAAWMNAFNMGWCLDCHRKPEMGAPTDCVVCHR